MDDSSTAIASTSDVRIDSLVLDAGPLVTQAPLRNLARNYYIPPSVVAELKDQRARDHLAWLQSETGGCKVEVREAGAEALAAVIAFAKQTGDYSVLSRPDLSVLALTYALEVQKHGNWRIRDEVGGKTGQQRDTIARQAGKKTQSGVVDTTKRAQKAPKSAGKAPTSPDNGSNTAETNREASAALAPEATGEDQPSIMMTELDQLSLSAEEEQQVNANQSPSAEHVATQQISDIEDEEDDEETGGEWITPDNITKHKNRALGLVTDEHLPPSTLSTRTSARPRTEIVHAEDGWSTVIPKKSAGHVDGQQQTSSAQRIAKSSGKMSVACMTGDYAVQNVLLQMGLSLVGIQGQQIKQVKSWVLRCHACFKICKDSDKKFCPQCGNPTLLRTSVTSTAPDSSSKGGGMQIHLKKNFQYKNRGTIYSLPLPKQGKASGAPQSVPILREDQPEWQKAVNAEKIKRQKEEKALQKALAKGTDSLSARYEDADELSMLLAGGNTKNRTFNTGLPAMGVGRKNPNERRRRKV